MSKRQQINITKKDADIIPFLKQKPNISQYIIRLIRNDMNKDNEKNRIIKIIEEYLSNKNLSSTKVESSIENSIKDIMCI